MGDGTEGFLPALADQQLQARGALRPAPEARGEGGRIGGEAQALALADQPPAALRDVGQQQAAALGEGGGGLVLDRAAGLVDPLAGLIRLPLLEGRQVGDGGGEAAPATGRQVAVAAVKGDQAIGQVAGLCLAVAAGGCAAGLDCQPGVTGQLGPLRFPVALHPRPEAGDVGRGHVGGDGGGLQLGPVLRQQDRNSWGGECLRTGRGNIPATTDWACSQGRCFRRACCALGLSPDQSPPGRYFRWACCAGTIQLKH